MIVTPPMRSFHGMAEVASATAKIRPVQLADEIVSVLSSDPNAAVKVTRYARPGDDRPKLRRTTTINLNSFNSC